MARFNDKNIIITGASGGIGAMLAWQIAADGGTPILIARSEQKLKQLAAEIMEHHQIKVYVYPADLADSGQVEKVLRDILENHHRISALINNAGTGRFALAGDMPPEETEAMFRLNVLAVIQATQLVLPSFIRQGSGHIVIVASQAGKVATPKSSTYAATKHAVLGYANALRMEVLPKGIFVTTVNPGPVNTGFLDIADPAGNYQAEVERYLLDPQQVAEKISRVLFKQKREINMPWWMEAGSRLYHLMPGMMERVLRRQFAKK